MAKYKVKVDRDLCIGAASCVAVAPKTYELDGEAKAVILKKDQSKTSNWTFYDDINDIPDNILNGARSCPVDAVIIVEVDDQGNEVKQIWPSQS